MNVDNCPRCGRVFMKGFNDVCNNCLKEVELQYERCVKYLRENRGAILQELSEATEVSVRQITKFIREGRISIMNSPNMGYPCDVCGTTIRESHICESCRSKLVKDVNNTLEDEKRKQAFSDRESQASFNIRDRLKERH